MPGHQAIIRTGVSVAFWLGESHELWPSPWLLVWVEWKAQLLERGFHCECSRRLSVVQILSLLLSTVSRCRFLFFWWHLERVDSIPAQFWCLTGSPGRSGRTRFCQDQSRPDHCQRRCQSLVCSRHQRGGSVLWVYVSIRIQIPSALSPIS